MPDLGNEPHVAAAKDYVTRNFSDHPGETSQFIYPATHPAAQRWLDDFLLRRLGNFGDYQDAISTSEPYLFHSLISPLLNIGLLTPKQVLESTLAFCQGAPGAS